MPAAAEDLALALELADAADAITMARFGAEDLVVETKSDLTPVREADRAVELTEDDHRATRLDHERDVEEATRAPERVDEPIRTGAYRDYYQRQYGISLDR